jgi:hypothetical protein
MSQLQNNAQIRMLPNICAIAASRGFHTIVSWCVQHLKCSLSPGDIDYIIRYCCILNDSPECLVYFMGNKNCKETPQSIANAAMYHGKVKVVRWLCERGNNQNMAFWPKTTQRRCWSCSMNSTFPGVIVR